MTTRFGPYMFSRPRQISLRLWALALTFGAGLACVPAIAAIWAVPVSEGDWVGRILDIPGLEIDAPVETALTALGDGAMRGPSCDGRDAVTANRRLSGVDWHVMAVADQDRVAAIELVSLGGQTAETCAATLEALARHLEAHGATPAAAAPEHRHTGFARRTTTQFTLGGGTGVSLTQRSWQGDGSCDLALRFSALPDARNGPASF